MAFRTERTSQADADLESIFDHVLRTHSSFGYSMGEAIKLAEKRAETIERDMAAISNVPFQGTLRPEFGPGVRNVTKNKAIFYFFVDEDAEIVRVLSIFYGGQDHLAHMRKRFP